MRPPYPILLLLLSAFLILSAVSADCSSNLFKLDEKTAPYAKCLDTQSMGAYYLQKSETGSRSWIIAFEGGGECVNKTGCTARSKTGLGSSANYTSTMELNQLQACSPDNPFANFNKVFVKYCSGDLFVGNFTAPTEAAWGLQFSGAHITMGVLNDIFRNHGFSHVEELVITGYSAGGLATVALGDWMVDWVYAHIQPDLQPYHTTLRLLQGHTLRGPKSALIPVAGYHFETNPIYTKIDPSDPAPAGYIPWKWSHFQQYYTTWSAVVPTRCAVSAHHDPSLNYECLIAQGAYSTMVTPTFVVQSTIDSVVLNLHGACPSVWGATPKQCNTDQAECPLGVKTFMQIWHGNMTTHIAPVKDKHINFYPELYPKELIQSGVKMDGAFGSACLMHTEFAASGPQVDGMNYFTAIKNWWLDDSVEGTSIAPNPKVNPHFHLDRCAPGDVLCGKCRH